MSLFVAAHVLAWLGFLFLVSWSASYPAYEGVTATATTPGEAPVEVEQSTATLFQVNGYRIIFLFLIPVIISGVALFSVYAEQKLGAKTGLTAWAAAITLVLFVGISFVTIIGISYLPAALTLLVAAVIRQRRRLAQQRPPRQREETWR
jgi:hypothetical protein